MKKNLLIAQRITIDGCVLHTVQESPENQTDPIKLASIPLGYTWYQTTVCKMNEGDISNPEPIFERLRVSFKQALNTSFVLLLPDNTLKEEMVRIWQVAQKTFTEESVCIKYHIPRSNDKLLEVYGNLLLEA